MPDPPPHRLALYALGALALVALTVWYLGRDGGASAGASRAAPAIRVERDGGGGSELTVHVAGAVRRPGVYRLKSGSRVDDAVQRAGGARPRADLSGLNLAAELEDGRQVLVPARAGGAPGGAAPPAATAAAPGGSAVAAATAAAAVPLNLNTATLEQLDQLDGIGPATAQQILQFRQAHGGFGSIEELGQVPGIGDKRLASLRQQVRV
jgi:competence protein ComEA